MTPTREVYWNISHVWVMYVLLVPTILFFSLGIYRHYRLWKRGRPDGSRTQNVKQRVFALAVYAFGHKRLFEEKYSGLFHFFLFSGVVILFIGTLVVMLDEDFGLRIMRGPFYLYFQSLALDMFGILAMMGTLMLAVKRYLARPDRLYGNTPERAGARRQNQWNDGVLLLLIFLTLVTGFLIEGLRIAATADPWGKWSPVGWTLAVEFDRWLKIEDMESIHRFLWWFHLSIVFGLIGWLPYTKLLHIITSTANIYFRSLEPAGMMLKPMNIETTERLGVSQLGDFSWKDLLDLDACTECGLCQAVCPATATDKPLSPKTLLLDLRDALHQQESDGSQAESGGLIGSIIKEDTLWSCTTCMACMRACPVMIEHVPKIVNMRRFLVMEEAKMPDLIAEALKSLEDRGHPFRGTSSSRTDWYRDLPVKQIGEVNNPGFLLWVGCASALNERNQRVIRSLARLLDRAGLNYVILGHEERCTGDPARRIGNEYLFEQIVRDNIQRLDQHGVKKIVTPCPHCFNCFKHEYPQFGGHYEVIHHSQLLAELVRKGELNPDPSLQKKVTYHDPCYLGRYNNSYEEPREVLRACARGRIEEMEKCRERAFCCGAGGGLMWTEELGTRINHERSEHALRTGAEVVAVSCPFCMVMLEDGVKAKADGRQVEVLDIAEVLDLSTVKNQGGAGSGESSS